MRFVFEIDPMQKPRMTRQDQWRNDPHHPDPKKRQRPAVAAYWLFKARLRGLCEREGFSPPEAGMALQFNVPMPPSWSGRKRKRMAGQPHQQVPDVDNYLKGFLDALLGEDCRVWHLAGLEKRWAESGSIVVTIL